MHYKRPKTKNSLKQRAPGTGSSPTNSSQLWISKPGWQQLEVVNIQLVAIAKFLMDRYIFTIWKPPSQLSLLTVSSGKPRIEAKVRVNYKYFLPYVKLFQNRTELTDKIIQICLHFCCPSLACSVNRWKTCLSRVTNSSPFMNTKLFFKYYKCLNNAVVSYNIKIWFTVSKSNSEEF